MNKTFEAYHHSCRKLSKASLEGLSEEIKLL